MKLDLRIRPSANRWTRHLARRNMAAVVMASRKKKKPHRRGRSEPRRGEPDAVLELPFGTLVQFGRFIEFHGTVSAEEHAKAVEALLESGDDLKREQRERHARLLEILGQVDPIDCVARLSLTYLRFNPDTFKEWESDRSPAHIEYLALQALGVGLESDDVVDPITATHLTGEAIEIVRDMFRDASQLLMMEAVAARRDRPDDPTVDYVLKTRLESLGIRGAGYHEHLQRVIRGCLDPFNRECRDLLGFTAHDALTLIETITALVDERIQPRWSEVAEARVETMRKLKRQRRRGGLQGGDFPDWFLALPPSEAKARINASLTAWIFSDSASLALVTPEDIAEHSGLDVATCRAFAEGFACPREAFKPEHHSMPGGAHPLTITPILSTSKGYLLPVPMTMIEAIRPRMEDLLRERDGRVWDRYVDARGRYVEKEATELLATALPGSSAWSALPWKSTAAESDLDGLVTADDISIRVQCKGGRLSASTRRGAPERMRRDIRELIANAADQHESLDTALASEGAPRIGFDTAQSAALATRFQVRTIVCLDDVTVWATETHKLRALGGMAHDEYVPWVLSLTDLMVTVDLLQGAQLAHYLCRRQRLERQGGVEAHDELDWVGHYISEGLYFDDYFEGDKPPDAFRLLSYTEPIDAWYFTRAGVRTVEAPKPAQRIPSPLDVLLRRLETERPEQWISIAISFLEGDQESRDLWAKAVKNAMRRVPEHGWSNATQVFDGRLGVTLYVDLRTPWPDIRARVSDYCLKKAVGLDQPNWIALGEGTDGGLFVTLIERDPERKFADLFIDPRLPRTTSSPDSTEGG